MGHSSEVEKIQPLVLDKFEKLLEGKGSISMYQKGWSDLTFPQKYNFGVTNKFSVLFIFLSALVNLCKKVFPCLRLGKVPCYCMGYHQCKDFMG